MNKENNKRVDVADAEMGGGSMAENKMKNNGETMNEMEIFDLRFFARSAKECDGAGIIKAMFEMTDEEGDLLTYDYHADSVEELAVSPSLYTIDWSGDTPADEIAQYECFRSTIEEVAGYVGPDKMIPMDRLPAPLAAFASVYLLPADAWYTEEERKAANDDMDLVEAGYQLDDDRLSALVLFADAVEHDAKTRVGSGPLAHDFVRRCQRLLILYSTGAPDFVIRAEENKLAYTMVIHYRGIRVLDY